MEKRLTLAAAALALIAIGLPPVLAMVANTFYVAGEFLSPPFFGSFKTSCAPAVE